MTKIAKKDFTTRTRRIRSGTEVTEEMLADAAMSPEELEAKGFIGEAPSSRDALRRTEPAEEEDGAEDGPQKTTKRR